MECMFCVRAAVYASACVRPRAWQCVCVYVRVRVRVIRHIRVYLTLVTTAGEWGVIGGFSLPRERHSTTGAWRLCWGSFPYIRYVCAVRIHVCMYIGMRV